MYENDQVDHFGGSSFDTPPTFDSLIAADGTLFFSGMDGSLQCYGE